jgi:regulatory protein
MSFPRHEGERDAIIIAFPQQRVTPAEAEITAEAIVVPLPGVADFGNVAVSESREETLVSESDTGVAEEDDSPPSERVSRRAHNVALHALAQRGQSRAELEARLVSRELPREAVNDEIVRLEQRGLIDDEALAIDLVDKYSERRGLGRQAVAHKLRERNIAPEIISRVLESVSDDDERARLLEVADDRARALRSLPPAVAKRRLVAYLQRRGFSGQDVFAVVNDVLG